MEASQKADPDDRIILALSQGEIDDLFECVQFADDIIRASSGVKMANLKILRSLLCSAWRAS